MIAFLLFAGSFLLLTYEGMLLICHLAPEACTRTERIALGFPLGALLNALIFFLCTLFGIPLLLTAIYGFHLLLVALLFLLQRQRHLPPLNTARKIYLSLPQKLWICILCLLLLPKLIFAFTHAVMLPTIYFDSLMEWNMRAKISFVEQQITFVGDTYRNATPQPQFPILSHALQILFMLPQGTWKDAISNAATLALTLASFSSFYLILKRRTNALWGLLGASLILMLPLLDIQSGQGYNDIHVIEFLLLSALFLVSFVKEGRRGDLLLSALLCSSAAWTKQEGFFLGVLPWMLLIAGVAWKIPARKSSIIRNAPFIAIGWIWLVFLLSKGLPLGPHSDDFAVRFYGGGGSAALQAFFTMGSFGIAWYAIIAVLVALLLLHRKRMMRDASILIVAWGGIAFIETIFIFFFTPNIRFLISHQTFHRTILIALAMLITGLYLIVERLSRKPKIDV